AEIALTASLVQENAPERFWNPNELFTRIYQQTHRKPLTQAAMSGLQRATADWLRSAPALTKAAQFPSVEVEQTRVAYNARRDAGTKAGDYDFAFRSPPARVPVFSVSDLEKLVSAPAIIWMKKFLGVEAADESGSPWHAATGQWVHQWLASVAGADGERTFVRVPTASELARRVRAAAEAKAAEVKRLCASADRPLPDWWSSGWQNAICVARNLGSKIATVRDWRWMATEWNIDAEERVAVGGNEALSFRGRIDLLLARDEAAPDPAASELWILDYKTGSNKPLVPAREDAEKRSSRLHNRLVKGEALQLGLYALAMRQHGAADVFLSIVSQAVRDVEPPQLSIADIAAHEDVFAELARMQRTGVFGMYGALRAAFGYAPQYPLATVAIDPDLLDAKWEETHPALAREEEEWESW
ncbi:MAG TPA: PD-(D/E)XK nuclease family protein, partial [Chthoniobacterales bacterium]|nr:PD-(D/E)XK nuclease family protein [Chthoniobacterales bacterium]